MATEREPDSQIPTEIVITKTRARYTKSKLEELFPSDMQDLSKGHVVTVFVRSRNRTPQQQDQHITTGPLPLRALCTFSPHIDAAVTKFKIRHLIVDSETLQRVQALHIVSDSFDGIDAVCRYISRCITSRASTLVPWPTEPTTPFYTLSAAIDAALYLGMNAMASMLRGNFSTARYQPHRASGVKWQPQIQDLIAVAEKYPRDSSIRRALAGDVWAAIRDDMLESVVCKEIEVYVDRERMSELAYDFDWAQDTFDPQVEERPEYSETDPDTESSENEHW